MVQIGVRIRFLRLDGVRIRFLRLETGLSLRELSQKAKCSAAAIMQIELGRSATSGKLLQKIARGLNVQPLRSAESRLAER